MEFQENIREFARTLDADFFGIADLSLAHEAIAAQGGPVVAQYPRAISIGIAMIHSIVDQLPKRDERAVAVNYRHHCYDIINQRLDHVASKLSSALQRAGHDVLPIPASKRVDDERICGLFSHKLGAHLAGLGWIGKSCLLVTPQVGPRVRWTTVLTDAPLQPTGTPMEERCGSCRQCVDICPPHAFTGQPFREHEPREVRYDACKCEQYIDEVKAKNSLPVCGMCVYVCPHGKDAGKHNDI